MSFFTNPKEGVGFNLVRGPTHYFCGVFSKPMYEFTLNRKTPLSYIDDYGRQWFPDFHFNTDQGSTPLSLQMFFPKDEFPISYAFHDSANKYGYLWVKMAPHLPAMKFHLTRFESNVLLEEMIPVEGKLYGGGGGWWKRHLIRAGVDLWASYKLIKEELC